MIYAVELQRSYFHCGRHLRASGRVSCRAGKQVLGISLSYKKGAAVKEFPEKLCRRAGVPSCERFTSLTANIRNLKHLRDLACTFSPSSSTLLPLCAASLWTYPSDGANAKNNPNRRKTCPNRGKSQKSNLGAAPDDRTQQVTEPNSEAYIMIPGKPSNILQINNVGSRAHFQRVQVRWARR